MNVVRRNDASTKNLQLATIKKAGGLIANMQLINFHYCQLHLKGKRQFLIFALIVKITA